MPEKTLGYILLVIGISLIVFALVHMFFVFTGKIPPVNLFNSGGISFDPSVFLSSSQGQITAGKQELISADYLNLSSNLFMELILMGFIASVGQKFASTGTSLIRPITVKLRAKDGTEYIADKK